MKALLLMTASGPLLVLSSHDEPVNEVFLGKLKAKGIEKFFAYEVPLEDLKNRYGGHFTKVMQDLHESDDLRVLDYNGQRIFDMFHLREFGEPIIHDPTS